MLYILIIPLPLAIAIAIACRHKNLPFGCEPRSETNLKLLITQTTTNEEQGTEDAEISVNEEPYSAFVPN